MLNFLIGAVIGVVMGLTGAGGALVSLPLFMTFLGMDLKFASVYSLIAVVVASTANFFSQKGQVHYRLSFIIIMSSGLGSLITAPFKAQFPELMMAILLVGVSLYALVNVWRGQATKSVGERPKVSISKSLLLGLLLGALTTFTGLGGGVMLVPVFLSVFNLNQDDAIVNSLFAVGLSSIISFLIQLRTMQTIELNVGLVFLALGIVLAALLVKSGLKYLSSGKVVLTRKIVFTAVVIYSTLKIFIKG